ncbi:hypothetical protein C7C46_18180 [Streptomyces tateyamensis]|uniref:Secreted protein n=1 Tax=Streptomyces tateyamensis TaxID=565073 RepID=A0A2V4P0Q0_9ACTN|nr:hypothetical protein [Streptomyces tateyamensis]PYC77720.1 hypothetical protein C7C46_18180 [Streptomyces tateyamensis]
MTRSLLLAAGSAALALLGAAPATAVAAPADPAPVTTCGYGGLQSGLWTKVCGTVYGGTVTLTGQISLAGPPSPGSPAPQPQQLSTTLTAYQGTQQLGQAQQGVVFTASTVQTNPLTVNASCGSTVHAVFSVSSYPWYNTPVTVDLPTTC